MYNGGDRYEVQCFIDLLPFPIAILAGFSLELSLRVDMFVRKICSCAGNTRIH
jgi:hypothetical protein